MAFKKSNLYLTRREERVNDLSYNGTLITVTFDERKFRISRSLITTKFPLNTLLRQ